MSIDITGIEKITQRIVILCRVRMGEKGLKTAWQSIKFNKKVLEKGFMKEKLRESD